MRARAARAAIEGGGGAGTGLGIDAHTLECRRRPATRPSPFMSAQSAAHMPRKPTVEVSREGQDSRTSTTAHRLSRHAQLCGEEGSREAKKEANRP
jgi:hypothetical protein